MDYVAAFGIGSTNFRYVGARPNGEFLTDIRVEPTRPHDLGEQVLDAVDTLEMETSGPLDAVSVSTTGLVDDTTGRIRKLDTPAGDTVDHIELGALLETERSLPLYLQNDCNAAALGEWHYGKRDTHGCVAHLTIGTGIGGGVVERGRLIRGEATQAGEFGLLPIAPDSDLQSCGITGAWEAVCSGRGIPKYVSHQLAREDVETTLDGGPELTAPDVFAAAEDGDAFASACLDRIARYNAAGIGAICNAVNPGLVTLGGGVALNNQEWVLGGIEDHLDEFCFVDTPDVRTTDLGDDIGLYGALATYRNRTGATDPLPDPAATRDLDD